MSLNQFIPTSAKGQLELTNATVLRNARVKTGATAFGAGTAVKLSSYSNGLVVEPLALTTDAIYGVVPFTAKKDTFSAGEVVRIVRKNAIISMEASGAIAFGANVEFVPTGSKIATADAGTVIGIALQEAKADGDIILVELA